MLGCPSCCLNCGSCPPMPTSSSHNPFALANLLPAGTLHLSLSPNDYVCDHSHLEDGWHALRTDLVLQNLTSTDDDPLLREVAFLVKHAFIYCTCRLGQNGNTLTIRVYLIPYDLSNVQGRLRVRDESTVLAPARRYLKVLLQRLAQDSSLWEGAEVNPHVALSLFFPHEKDNRTMAEIYGDLPSPSILSGIPKSSLIHRIYSGEEIYGMRSEQFQLYGYQRRSVAAMIQKETHPVDIMDPLFIPITGIDGKTFYMQPSSMEVLKESPVVQQNRGGVLCEEMGTGKTVMILALILSTLDQMPSPEDSVLDTRPILTPLAFRHFLSAEFAEARMRSSRPKTKNVLQSNKVPSLVELLLHRINVSPGALRNRRLLDDMEDTHPHLLHYLRQNAPFYHHYDMDLDIGRRPGRKQSNPGPRQMLLTSATLMVVPRGLVSQWDNQISKHCHSVLRVLVIKKQAIPDAKTLASDYDIIIMSHDRFAAEARRSDVAKLHSWNSCKCSEIRGTRIPDCRCLRSASTEVSPLLQIRWKRLAVDEGHVTSATSTNLAEMSRKLSVERRWIVTGTPTTNLLGLSFGQQAEQADPLLEAENSETISSSSSTDQFPSKISEASDLDCHINSIRRWTRHDREDLRKLSTMMTHFLGVPHFTANPKMLNEVIDPLMDHSGPRHGAIQVLTRVMSMIMIRHRTDDVEADVVLPPVKQETILLDLDPYARKSYNALQAAIAINAVDSERKDQDYLFHPSNVASLLNAMSNLSQIMFWSASDDLYNVDQIHAAEKERIDTAKDRGVPKSDLTLLEAAFRHVAQAASDNVWRGMHAHEDVPFRVSNISTPIFNAWTRIELRETLESAECAEQTPSENFIHPDRLNKLFNTVLRRPCISHNDLVDQGLIVDQKDRQDRKLYLEQQKRSKRSRRDTGELVVNHSEHLKKAVAPEMKEVEQELRVAQEQQMALLEEDEGDHIATTVKPSPLPLDAESLKTKIKLLGSSALSGVRIGQSASSKLNYIIQDVLQYSPEEKFLVFSNSALTIAHVADALKLIKIEFLQYTTQFGPHEREKMVMTFETAEKYRVFLMELKHGARGLNLVSASRVIFCEPVWQADVESQAIKRAHRIGQTRPINVKTLAIRSTSEEAMIKRRHALKSSGGKIPSMTEESGMRHFIENPAFLEGGSDLPPINIDFIDMVCGMEKNKITEPEDSAVYVTLDDVSGSSSVVETSAQSQEHPPKKKRKGVRFADE